LAPAPAATPVLTAAITGIASERRASTAAAHVARRQAQRRASRFLGLIWRCVEDGELVSAVEDLARQFAAAPTRGLARTKQAIYEGLSRTLPQQLDIERDYQGELGHSMD